MEAKNKPGKENIRPPADKVNHNKKSSKKRSLAEMKSQHSDENEKPRQPIMKFRPNGYRAKMPSEFLSTPSSEDEIVEKTGSLSLVMKEADDNKKNQQQC